MSEHSTIISIATPADRAWERFRCAIIQREKTPEDKNIREVVAQRREEWVRAVSE